jgi:hypothetical protein
MFYLLKGVGGSYRIHLAHVACVEWKTTNERNEVLAQITFNGGGKTDLKVQQIPWSDFLAAIEKHPNG